MKLSIRDISVRLHDLTGLGHLYEDAYTRYQDKTPGSHGFGTLI